MDIELKSVNGTSYQHKCVGYNATKAQEHPFHDVFRLRKNGYEIWIESRTSAYLSARIVPKVIIRITHQDKQYSEEYFVGVHASFGEKELDEAMLAAKKAVETVLHSISAMSDLEGLIAISESKSYSFVNTDNHYFQTAFPFALPWEPMK